MAVYIYLSQFCHPAADDFTYAYKGNTENIFNSLINEYLSWNGRYISNIFVLINPLAFGFEYLYIYKIIPVVIILLTIVGFYFFLKTITNNLLTNIDLWLYSLLISLLYIFQMPDIAEGFYWFTGAFTYQLANIFALLFLISFINFLKKKYLLNKVFHLIITILLLFIVIGFNEVIMLIIFCFMLVLFFISYQNKHHNRKTVLIYLIFTVLFSCIVFFAPGNHVRGVYFTENHNLFYSLQYTGLQTLRFSIKWISSAAILLSSVLYIPLSNKLSKKATLFSNSFYLTPLLSSAFLLLIIFVCVFPAYWSTGILGQHRTVNTAYFFFIILWFINLTVWINYFKNKANINFSLNNTIKLIFVLIIWLDISFTRNGYGAAMDIFYNKARNFDKQMTRRYQIIEQNKETDNEFIYFKPIQEKPNTLFVLDITDNPEHWLNRGYIIYFKSGQKKIMKR